MFHASDALPGLALQKHQLANITSQELHRPQRSHKKGIGHKDQNSTIIITTISAACNSLYRANQTYVQINTQTKLQKI